MSVLVESNSAMMDTTLPFSMRGVSPSTTNFKFPYTRNGETRQTIAMRFETVRQEYIYIMQSNFVCSTYSPKYITYKYLALHPFFLPSQTPVSFNIQYMFLMGRCLIFWCSQIYESFPYESFLGVILKPSVLQRFNKYSICSSNSWTIFSVHLCF